MGLSCKRTWIVAGMALMLLSMGMVPTVGADQGKGDEIGSSTRTVSAAQGGAHPIPASNAEEPRTCNMWYAAPFFPVCGPDRYPPATTNQSILLQWVAGERGYTGTLTGTLSPDPLGMFGWTFEIDIENGSVLDSRVTGDPVFGHPLYLTCGSHELGTDVPGGSGAWLCDAEVL